MVLFIDKQESAFITKRMVLKYIIPGYHNANQMRRKEVQVYIMWGYESRVDVHWLDLCKLTNRKQETTKTDMGYTTSHKKIWQIHLRAVETLFIAERGLLHLCQSMKKAAPQVLLIAHCICVVEVTTNCDFTNTPTQVKGGLMHTNCTQ